MSDTSILRHGETEAPAAEIPFLFLPGRDLFARRAERLRFLSQGHSLGGYLSFLALIADAQQEALNRFSALFPPGPEDPFPCRDRGIPLPARWSRPRDPAWRKGLTMILQQISAAALPTAARETIAGLRGASEEKLEETANRILAGDLFEVSPCELPLVAAALQLHWVHMASTLEEKELGRREGGLCPVCGSHPVTGVVRNDVARQGLRYLCCALCATQWHMVRIKCSSCKSTKGIAYFALEGSNGAIKAESCDDCGTYLKLLYLGKDGRMEATADDLATLALDMLMDEEGKTRCGPNLLFHPGVV